MYKIITIADSVSVGFAGSGIAFTQDYTKGEVTKVDAKQKKITMRHEELKNMEIPLSEYQIADQGIAKMLSRYLPLTLAVILVSFLAAQPARAGMTMEVWKTSSCGCCVAWIRILEQHGYTVRAQDVPMAELVALKRAAGIGENLASCHTARIAGYVVEGHVPPKQIDRLIAERPDAVGLAVPGMPVGSPGMGEPGPGSEPYEVLLIRADGRFEAVARYPN